MARKTESSAQKKRPSWVAILGYSARVAVAGVLLVCGLYAFHRVEQYLVSDSRFLLVAPDIGLESPSLRIDGIRFTSRMQVLRVFSGDFGRSAYLLPLEERRAQLRALDWVKDATVSRIWPNRVYVRIVERTPIAYVQVPVDRFSRIALIDAEGKILQQPPNAPFALPVVSGIGVRESSAARLEKMKRFQYLMKDIGPLVSRISEVDVAERDNLKVTAKEGNRAVVLLLGDEHFGRRLQNFVNHYPDIQRRLPGATMLDLRLDDRITAVEDTQ